MLGLLQKQNKHLQNCLQCQSCTPTDAHRLRYEGGVAWIEKDAHAVSKFDWVSWTALRNMIRL